MKLPTPGSNELLHRIKQALTPNRLPLLIAGPLQQSAILVSQILTRPEPYIRASGVRRRPRRLVHDQPRQRSRFSISIQFPQAFEFGQGLGVLRVLQTMFCFGAAFKPRLGLNAPV
jgi:hypothetical protein